MVAQPLASLEALSPLLWRASDTIGTIDCPPKQSSPKEKEERLLWFDRRCRRGLFSDLGGGHSVAAATGATSGELRSIFRTTRSLQQQVPLSWPYLTLISSFFSWISFTFYVFWKRGNLRRNWSEMEAGSNLTVWATEDPYDANQQDWNLTTTMMIDTSDGTENFTVMSVVDLNVTTSETTTATASPLSKYDYLKPMWNVFFTISIGVGTLGNLIVLWIVLCE